MAGFSGVARMSTAPNRSGPAGRGEVNGRSFTVVQRADEFCGQRRLGQAQVLVAKGEEQAIFAVNDGLVYRTA